MPIATAVGLSDVLTSCGSVITAVMGYVGDVAQLVVSEPIFVLPLGFFVIGGAIGIFSRILHK